MRRDVRVLVAVILLFLVFCGVWAFWEVYKFSIDWGKRHTPFPSPFYLWWWDTAIWIDFAITLILFAAVDLTYLAIQQTQEVKKE